MQVLIVEDEAPVALHLEQDLIDEGRIVVGIAPDWASAMRVSAEARPDLVFVDVGLVNGDTG